MDKNKQKPYQENTDIRVGDQFLGDLTWEEVQTMWHQERRKFFMRDKRANKMTNEQVAKKRGVTRQNVGKILGPKKTWESVA